MNGGVDEEAEEVLRLGFTRLEELRTDEKVGANGEAETVLMEGLLDAPCLRAEDSADELPRLVAKGVKPRRAPAV